LNERSLSPPISVTRPTLIFLASGVLSAVLLLVDDEPEPESSSLPQAVTTVQEATSSSNASR
jgi:hypothetical protein